MNRLKRTLMNLGLKYVKPRIYDVKNQYIHKNLNLPEPDKITVTAGQIGDNKDFKPIYI